MNGLFLINKPKGKTSFWVVNFLKRRFGLKKIGHAGTLDPLATGLLILMVGKYTKKFDSFQKMKKEYKAEIVFGQRTDTYDAEGKIIDKYKSSIALSEKKLLEVFKKYIGCIEQTPPLYSAVKIKGQPAYKRARRGENFEIKPKSVTIYNLKINKIQKNKLFLTINCSSGTYIRSLANDLGNDLGTGAYLENLRRIGIGNYKIKDAKLLDMVKITDLMI